MEEKRREEKCVMVMVMVMVIVMNDRRIAHSSRDQTLSLRRNVGESVGRRALMLQVKPFFPLSPSLSQSNATSRMDTVDGQLPSNQPDRSRGTKQDQQVRQNMPKWMAPRKDHEKVVQSNLRLAFYLHEKES